MTAGDERYSRHRLLPQVGPDGQAKLQAATVLIVGCGALGSHQAGLLARAGVNLRLVDRDLLEPSNLQRQVLYDEDDLASGLPKALLAARRLARFNPHVAIDAHVRDVAPGNVVSLLAGVSLVLDGTDNLETRYLLNDACVKHGIPWVYGGVEGVSGLVLPVLPGRGPCLRCLFPDPPAAGSLPTCDTVGVLNTLPALVAAVQTTWAFKILLSAATVEPHLLVVDLWRGDFQAVRETRDPACPCCGAGRYDFLTARQVSRATRLCGRQAVQVAPAAEEPPSMEALRARLAPLGGVTQHGPLLCFQHQQYKLTVFPDGRVLVAGTDDEALARSLVARFIGG